MKTILFLCDHSQAALNAASFLRILAAKTEAKILCGYTYAIKKADEKILAAPVMDGPPDAPGNGCNFTLLNRGQNTAFHPEIEEIDLSDMDEAKVAEVVNKNNIWMMVKGITNGMANAANDSRLNVHTILNKVLCPLLLVPDGWQAKDIERLVYIADLRYCRIQIVKYLVDIASFFNADVSIAHISAKGLPKMEEKYALSVFDEVCSKMDYDRIFFNNIKEQDIPRTIDVMVHAMHTDILAIINHRFHFEQMMGRYICEQLPAYITVPLLIFPY